MTPYRVRLARVDAAMLEAARRDPRFTDPQVRAIRTFADHCEILARRLAEVQRAFLRTLRPALEEAAREIAAWGARWEPLLAQYGGYHVDEDGVLRAWSVELEEGRP